jgi:uncharacterized protein (DUF1800 family)
MTGQRRNSSIFLATGAAALLCFVAILPAPADEPVAPTSPPSTPQPTEPQADPLAPLAAEAWTLQHAEHLLRRAGFGGTAAEIAALHAMGIEGAVDHLLTATDDELPPFVPSVTGRPSREQYKDKTQEERQAIQRDYRRSDRKQLQTLREWWIQRMIATQAPLEEKMVLFWHGHFCSDHQDTRNSYHLFQQNETFRRQALGNFGHLVHAVAKDPAMLEYLDNNKNRASSPNENFAREVMELFVLGVGNYTEKDIKEAARAFTGWTFAKNKFVKNRRQHDFGDKTVLGTTGPLDGEDVIEILLERPVAARFIARKLLVFFATTNPDDATVRALAQTLRKGNYEIAPTLRRLFLSEAFYAQGLVGEQIKSPIDLIVGTFRSLPIAPPNNVLPQVSGRLGQELFQPPNVKGWPGDREWISTTTLFDRYNLMAAFFGTLDAERIRAMGSLQPRMLIGAARETMAAMKRDEAEMKEMKERQDTPDSMEPMDGEDMMEGAEPNMEGDEPDMQMQEEKVEKKAAKPNKKKTDRQRRLEQRRKRQEEAQARKQLRLFDPVPYCRSQSLTTPEAVADHLAEAMLAVQITDADRAIVIEALSTDAKGAQTPFALEHKDARRRIDSAIQLIVNMPEYQLN